MATEGSVYQRKDGRWVAQYTDAKGKTRYLYRKTKTEAKKALRQALKDRDDIEMYLDEWMDERRQTVSHRTWRVQESIIRCRVKPHIGSHRPSKLSGKDRRRSRSASGTFYAGSWIRTSENSPSRHLGE